MITFHQAHAASQDVAVVEQELFEEHDEKMKVFRRRNHPDISQLTTANTGGDQKSLNLAEWSNLVAVGSMTKHRFSPN